MRPDSKKFKEIQRNSKRFREIYERSVGKANIIQIRCDVSHGESHTSRSRATFSPEYPQYFKRLGVKADNKTVRSKESEVKSSWIGIVACCLVIYFGVVHASSTPAVLLNEHALILVIGGTFAIMLLTYSIPRLLEVMDYILFGFLFRAARGDLKFAMELLLQIDVYYNEPAVFHKVSRPHPFIEEAMSLTRKEELDVKNLQIILVDRKNALKRKYMEDAKILNNIAKYPPHLGLLGAASGMIEMMSGLGKVGVETIGLAMATALTATLWGVGLNNFVFLPLADNATKAAEDELYRREIVIECCLMMKRKVPHGLVISACANKLPFLDRQTILNRYVEAKAARSKVYDAA